MNSTYQVELNLKTLVLIYRAELKQPWTMKLVCDKLRSMSCDLQVDETNLQEINKKIDW